MVDKKYLFDDIANYELIGNIKRMYPDIDFSYYENDDINFIKFGVEVICIEDCLGTDKIYSYDNTFISILKGDKFFCNNISKDIIILSNNEYSNLFSHKKFFTTMCELRGENIKKILDV